jgi:hypothetical protein
MMRNLLFPKPSWLIWTGLIILGLWIAPGCRKASTSDGITPTPPAPTEVTPSVTAHIVSTPEATSTEVVTPTSTPELMKRPQYEISAELDYPNQRVTVEERILFLNPAGKVLDGMDLVVPPNNWWGVFSIQDINAGDLPLEGYTLNGVKLNLVFGNSGWQPGEVLELQIKFTLDLPLQNDRPGYGPSPFGYTSLQTNLVDWYPMVAPYQEDVGWLIHDPYIFGEYLVYPAADFEVSLRTGMPGLIVAASADPVTDGDQLRYSLTTARNFVFSISPVYEVLEEDLNGVKVYGYFFPGDKVSGQAAFETTVQALGLYQDLYGPYQQSSISMVQADFYHGMEYEGLYFQSRAFFNTYAGSEKSYLVSIAAHETAHQWWYGQVANDQALEPWLDEAFCTFSELAYYENLYPQSVDWWWNTRVNYYQPSGRIDRSIYGFKDYVDQYLNYRNATYLQGAKFMAALKDHLGEEAFYHFLQEYGDLNRNRIATGEDFFELLGDYLDLSELVWLGEYFPLLDPQGY